MFRFQQRLDRMLSFWRDRDSVRRCRDLLPLSAILPHLDLRTASAPQLRRVPLERIVGSSGRAQDFDRHFVPRRRLAGERWQRIVAAYQQGRSLPPVSLVQIGDAYFVEDGHHRIAVARERGQRTILARVVRLDSSPLVPDRGCTRLGYRLPGKEAVSCP